MEQKIEKALKKKTYDESSYTFTCWKGKVGLENYLDKLARLQ